MPNIRWLLALVTRLQRLLVLETDGAIGGAREGQRPWPLRVRAYRAHEEHRRRSAREIPIFLLERASSTGA